MDAVRYHPPMDRAAIIERLRAREGELRAAGVLGVSLFGSVARGAATDSSDVDLAVRLGPDFARGGFQYFGRLEALRRRLSEIVGRDVDLVEEPVEKVRLQREIDEARVRAF